MLLLFSQYSLNVTKWIGRGFDELLFAERGICASGTLPLCVCVWEIFLRDCQNLYINISIVCLSDRRLSVLLKRGYCATVTLLSGEEEEKAIAP